jgi:hypothetical protein
VKIEFEPDRFSLTAFVVLVVAVCATYVAVSRPWSESAHAPPAPQRIQLEIKFRPDGKPMIVPINFTPGTIDPINVEIKPNITGPATLELAANIDLRVNPDLKGAVVEIPIRIKRPPEPEPKPKKNTKTGRLLPPPDDVVIPDERRR